MDIHKHGDTRFKMIGCGRVRIEDRYGDEITIPIEDVMAFAAKQMKSSTLAKASFLEPRGHPALQVAIDSMTETMTRQHDREVESFLAENEADPAIHQHVIYRNPFGIGSGKIYDESHVLMPKDVNPEGITVEQACVRFPNRRIWREVKVNKGDNT